MKTEQEAKAECIKELEKLIEDIKNDKTGDCYSFNYELLERYVDSNVITSYVRYGIQRNEYYFKNTEN